MTGNTLYGYQLLRLLGTGGMADIYYAENSLGKRAAVKILKRKYSDERTVHDRFVSEAKTTVQLHHPNIREVYDLGEIDGRPAMLMEYLEGQSLWEVLKAQGRVDEEKARDWFRQTVSGLQYAHSRGVIHRDIKPSNLFLTHDGTIKILDFGIAKVKENITMTQTGQTLGTLIYMSPEQVMDPKRVDERTDIYSLGVTFYHLLTGQTPYSITTDSGYVIQKKIVEEELVLVDLQEVWQVWLGVCLNKDVRDRSWVKVLDVQDQYRMTAIPELVTERVEDEVTLVVTKVTPEKKEQNGKNRPPLWSRIRPKGLYISLLILIPLLVWGLWKYIPDFSRDGELRPYFDPNARFWGLKKGERIITPPQFHFIYPFLDGMAKIEKDGKIGKLDKKGILRIPTKYDEIEDYDDSLFKVRVNERWGVIDHNNKQIVPIEYNEIGEFSEGLAWVELNDNTGFVNRKGEVVVQLKYENAWWFSEGLIAVELNDKWGFIDKEGKEVIPLKYENAWPFSEGLTAVELNDKWGFIDKKGQEIIPLKYDHVKGFSGGLAAVRLNDKWGFIDKKGKEVTLLKYDEAWSFSDGLAEVAIGDSYDEYKYGYIDRYGKEIIPASYSHIEEVPSESLFVVILDGERSGRFANGDKYANYGFTGGKWSILNKKGNSITSVEYDFIRSYSEGFFCVSLNKKQGFIDKEGKEVTPLKYDEAWSFSEGLAEVKLNGKWGFVDQRGLELVPLKYDNVYHFSDGIAFVSLDNKIGCIDKDGKIVIPLKYDRVIGPGSGRIWAELNGKWGLFDLKGNVIIPFIYDDVWPFRDGLAKVELNGRLGFIDQEGNEVIPIKYDKEPPKSYGPGGFDGYDFDEKEGVRRMIFKNKYGFVDRTGREVIPPIYDTLSYFFHEGLVSAKYNGKWGFVDRTGQQVIPFKYDDILSDFRNEEARVEYKGKKFNINKQGEQISISVPVLPEGYD